MKLSTLVAFGLGAGLAADSLASPDATYAYSEAIRLTGEMARNQKAQELAREFGLQILDLTWEDTGRYKNSAVGPNISDMTIQVGQELPGGEFKTTCMPVIRFPNFSDQSCDLDPGDFTLLVGNQKGGGLKRISLREFLSDPTPFLSNPDSWKTKQGKPQTLLAERDSKVLVSAQACFLPIPKEGKATFNPVLFNYQSIEGDPAVLTLLATREGTSVTVIDNKRDAFRTGAVWGQRLFFNNDGQRASLTGQRESDFTSQQPASASPPATPTVTEQAALNMVLLIQVPLKQKNPPRPSALGWGGLMDDAKSLVPATMPREEGISDVENAVIGHGALEGPFTEMADLDIERDPKFPVRVTVQFYKGTSNGVVSREDLKAIKHQIDQVYAKSDYVGSLVTGGDTGRVTEYEGVKVQPEGWWEEFWARHEKNTGDDRKTAIKKLRKLLGRDYMEQPVSDLYVRNLLK